MKHLVQNIFMFISAFAVHFSSVIIYAHEIRNMLVYSIPRHNAFQNVIIHNGTREVYVGARNAIYHFDDRLRLKIKVSTGPELDHIECLRTVPCEHKLVPSDNDNKVLLIYYGTKDLLLSCGSLYNGMCNVRTAVNMSMNHRWVGNFNDTVNFIGGKKSVVAFTGPGLRKSESLYSAATYDGRPLRYTQVTVTSKVISFNNTNFKFHYTHESLTSHTGANFHSRFKKNYEVNYLYGFSHGNYSYFVTTQRISVDSEVMETRLARVCNSDPTFFSYTEMALRCHRGVGDIYKLATAAYLGVAGTQLKRRLKLEEVVDVLYVTFVMTQPQHEHVVDYTKGTVLCSFPMSQVVSFFTNATRDCFLAEPRTHLLKHVLGVDMKCAKHDDAIIDDGFCGSGLNHYIEGTEIPGGVRTHFMHYVTSLTVILQFGKTVAVIGSEEGKIMKMVLERRNAEPLYTIDLASNETGENRSIRSSSALDASQENIYFLTANKVVKFPIGSCSVYTSCGACLTNDDPLTCGWCGSYCAHLAECERPSFFSRSSCPPVIFNVTPLTGPTGGGTLLKITGDNFGSSQTGEANSHINVTVAGWPCSIVLWKKDEVHCETEQTRSRGEVSGPVSVEVMDVTWTAGQFDMNGTATSNANFSFHVPWLHGAYPSYGPVSGGTNVTLIGQNLNIGSHYEIYVNHIKCSETRIFHSMAWCVTGNAANNSAVAKGPVEIHIDKVVIELEAFVLRTPSICPVCFSITSTKMFSYLPNPNIWKISPQVTTVSGTNNLTVTGTNLNSVAYPYILVIVTSALTGQKMEIEKSCEHVDSNGTEMICPTPSIDIPNLHAPTERAPLVSHVAFVMDGVTELRDLPLYNRELSQLLYYPDPEYFPFSESEIEGHFEEKIELEIKGKYLNLAHNSSDIRVVVDDHVPCIVTVLAREYLVCTMPPVEYLSGNSSKHYVSVFVGPLHYRLGYVTFLEKPPSKVPLAVVIALVVVIVIIIALYFIFRRRCQHKSKGRSPRYLVTFSNGRENEDTCNGRQASNDYLDMRGNRQLRCSSTASAVSCRAQSTASEVPFIVDDETRHLLETENILIRRDLLELGEVLGEGYFGRVYMGKLALPGKDTTREVAVKTLHNCFAGVVERNIAGFLREGLMMKDFHHPNVLTLIGVCFESNGSPLVIIPYMKFGDIRSFIKNGHPKLGELFTFGVQIASGMKYLSEIKFVHRDLAARNCMLDADFTAKVADFGLSRDIYEQEYYSSDNRSKLPIKWMAPECLEKGTYSTKTDVWSFGIVLWELMTRGDIPYPTVGNWELVDYLKSGRRLPQSSYCPDAVYNIMCDCWSYDPNGRPTFAELEGRLQEVISNFDAARNNAVGLDVTYMNCPGAFSEELNEGMQNTDSVT